MIQRYEIDNYGNELVAADGHYVTYADHLAALTVDDAMVRRACAAHWKKQWTSKFYTDTDKLAMMQDMRAALTAALERAE